MGEGLAIEAVAADGLIEAFRVEKANRFALAVQWHPEWQFQDNDFYSAIFDTFGNTISELKIHSENIRCLNSQHSNFMFYR